jgi:hypothetical protein
MSVLSLQTLTNSGLFQSGAASQEPSPSVTTAANVPIPLPVNPTRRSTEKAISSPLPSPSQLTCFLAYAESHLGVRNTSMYEGSLELQGIGPDILGDIDDKVLSGIGISTSDIIRIKKGSTIWWNGPDAKRKWSNTSRSSGTEHGRFGSPKAEPPKKKVAYEKQSHDGGASRFSAGPMQPDDGGDAPDVDFD